MLASSNIAAAAPDAAIEPPARDARPAGLRSPTVFGLHSAGWLLLLCMFLPVSRGCNGTVIRPADGLVLTAPVSAADLLNCLWMLSVYGNGVMVACVVTLSALTASRKFWWAAFTVQFGLAIGMAVTFAIWITVHTDSLKHWLEQVLSLLPVAAGGTAWIALAIRRGQQEQAWARLQHLWTAGAWLQLHLCCLFSGQLLYGYWLTLLALMAQLFATELARHRLAHDLWDSSQPPRRLQFSLASVFAWMTILPLIVAYYQLLAPALDWLFPDA